MVHLPRELSASAYVHTQTIDGFFGHFKSGVRGAHHAVSHKWLQGYLNEWTCRYNRREDGNRMFRDLIETAAGCCALSGIRGEVSAHG